MSKKKKKPYHANNCKAIRNTPAEYFEDPDREPLTFEEFMEWKVGGYELPSSHVCIIRTMNIKTGKVKEYAYKRPEKAKKKLVKLMAKGTLEFTICDEEHIHLLQPKVDYR